MARMRDRRSLFLPFVLLLLMAGIAFWIWYRFVPRPAAAMLSLTPVAFADLPGWNESDLRAALAAFRLSCATFAHAPVTRSLGGTGYAGKAVDWEGACAAIPSGFVAARTARNYFEKEFTPVAVSAGNDADALFTGYYEPEIHVSRTRHGIYATPIYGLPDDLLSVDLGLFRGDLAGQRVTGRIDGHAFVPYFTRAEIDASGLARAPVLFYADDPANVFFLHVQGSGRARVEHGGFVRLTYAGQNGRPYTSIGHTLIAEGAIDRDQMSMQAIRAWLRAHPEDARRAMESDASYVFFKETPLGDASLGSPGSEGVPLMAEASIAVDTKLHPLGAPFYLAATAPDADPSRPDRAFDRLLVAQDTGGAIKGAARADVFWGFGADAESIAGRMKAKGRFFVLLPKPVAARLSPRSEFSAVGS
jgi:membrane-bound lytic murein transglycosylase A